MNILLTGATGLLGSYVVKIWNPKKGFLCGVYLGKYKIEAQDSIRYYCIDVIDKSALEKLFHEYKIDIVLHAAGEARVDFCEKHYNVAYSTNVIGTKNIIELCKKYNAKLAYVSTNAVFNGKKPPYREEDIPNPINIYGKIKLECENLVKKAFNDFLIVRPILMYGWNRPEERDNTATWLLKKLKNNEEIKLVDDIFDNPLYAMQCADSILRLIKNGKRGIYHISGKDIMTRYQFGLKIAEVFGYDKNLISPVKSSYFIDIAPRPVNASYDTNKIRCELGVIPLSVEEGLRRMIKEREYATETTSF